MSYTYLLATGEESLADSFQAMCRFVPWKSTADAGKFYFNGSETESYLGFQYGITSKLLTEHPGGELQMLLAVGFLAPTYPLPERTAVSMERKKELTEKAQACGLKWQESLKRFNLNLSVLKTPQILELKDSAEFSKTLPQWGMILDGVCFSVATSAQTISEKEFASLLPTPTAHNAKEGAYPAEYTRNTPTLSAQVGGKINPDWNEWRMGCPTKWSDLNPLATDKFQQWLQLHGKF